MLKDRASVICTNVNGADLYYEVLGNDDAPAVISLHGGPGISDHEKGQAGVRAADRRVLSRRLRPPWLWAVESDTAVLERAVREGCRGTPRASRSRCSRVRRRIVRRVHRPRVRYPLPRAPRRGYPQRHRTLRRIRLALGGERPQAVAGDGSVGPRRADHHVGGVRASDGRRRPFGRGVPAGLPRNGTAVRPVPRRVRRRSRTGGDRDPLVPPRDAQHHVHRGIPEHELHRRPAERRRARPRYSRSSQLDHTPRSQRGDNGPAFPTPGSSCSRRAATRRTSINRRSISRVSASSSTRSATGREDRRSRSRFAAPRPAPGTS